MQDTLRVDIVSDMVCPWCYIGWSRLKKAAASLGPEVELDVHWLPFELNPQMPPEGLDRRQYLAAKFGEEGARRSQERISAAAAEDGLAMDLERIARSPSTLKAHRLMLLAEEAGRGTALAERLFDDYFAQGRDIGSDAVLADAAGATGIAREEALAFLEGEAGTEEVRAMEGEAHRLGISGVPFFILDRRLAVSGAQAPEVMVEAARKALAMRAEVDGGPAEA
jgi:predicted DsbA family dithiol-disulfide isomerase